MAKQIRIATEGVNFARYDQFVPFQGSLKTLTVDAYGQLREEILRLGFSEALNVWHRDGKELVLLNGHQRIACVKMMVEEEGFECPPLPFNFTQVTDEQEAALRVLGLTSNYGTMTEESLHKYLVDRGIRVQLVVERFRFPEVNMKSLVKRCEEPVKKTDETTKNPTSSPQFIVSIDCRNEAEQQALYEELLERNFVCKLIS